MAIDGLKEERFQLCTFLTHRITVPNADAGITDRCGTVTVLRSNLFHRFLKQITHLQIDEFVNQ